MEEVHVNMPDYNGKSVALLDYPKESHEYSKEVLDEYKEFIKLRLEANKAIETIRSQGLVGSSQEALLVLPKSEFLVKSHLCDDLCELARLFIVSKVELVEKGNIEAHHIDAKKCPRCWNYVDELYPVDEETSVCARCKHALGK